MGWVGGGRCRVGDEVLCGGADVDLVGRSSGMMSIGVAAVSGHASLGRELELRYEGPRLVPVRRIGGAGVT